MVRYHCGMRCVVKLLLLCIGGICAVEGAYFKYCVSYSNDHYMYRFDADCIVVELPAFRRIFNSICCYTHKLMLHDENVLWRENENGKFYISFLLSVSHKIYWASSIGTLVLATKLIRSFYRICDTQYVKISLPKGESELNIAILEFDVLTECDNPFSACKNYEHRSIYVDIKFHLVDIGIGNFRNSAWSLGS